MKTWEGIKTYINKRFDGANDQRSDAPKKLKKDRLSLSIIWTWTAVHQVQQVITFISLEYVPTF